MSIEAFLLRNLIADFILLSVVCRSVGCFHWKRVLAADALCALYAVPASASPGPWACVPVQLALLMLVSMLLTRRFGLRYWRGTALGLGTAALACGGAAKLVGYTGLPGAAFGIVVGLALLSALFAARPPDLNSWQVTLCLRDGNATARFPALIDTGNRLREPLSGLPVLIAEAALLKGILPGNGYRELCFGAVGAQGRMRCFKPREIWIERGNRHVRAPDAWVAIAPGNLPGAYRALAPTEFALCATS